MGGKGSGRKPNNVRASCGTRAGYLTHIRFNQTPCEACKRAAAKYARDRYKPKRPKNASRVNVKAYVRREKVRRGSCIDCGLVCTPNNTFVFDFDHRDPTIKSFTISQKVNDVAQADLDAEMAKCDLVCSNCHRYRTHKQHQLGILTGFRKDNCVRVDSPTLFD